MTPPTRRSPWRTLLGAGAIELSIVALGLGGTNAPPVRYSAKPAHVALPPATHKVSQAIASPDSYAFDRSYTDVRSAIEELGRKTHRQIVNAKRAYALPMSVRVRSREEPTQDEVFEMLMSVLNVSGLMYVPPGRIEFGGEGESMPAQSWSSCTSSQEDGSAFTVQLVHLRRLDPEDAAWLAHSQATRMSDATPLQRTSSLILADTPRSAACVVALVERVDGSK